MSAAPVPAPEAAAAPPAAPSWDDLVTTALVGTGRRPMAPPAAPDGTPLDLVPPTAGAGLATGETPGGRVLSAAAVLSPWRRAGRILPGAPGPVPDPSPDDRRPACTPRAAQLLDVMIGGGTTFGEVTPLATEWLRSCAAAGARVPHRLLVPLLARATADRALREPLLAVLDERGAWLAARNDAWSWAAGTVTGNPATDWATAGRNRRVALLGRLRATDPAAGRALLAADLAGLPAPERAELVAVLAVGLGDEDEPLLDALLDDRAKAVRVAAAGVLDGLVGSRRARRLTDRLLPLVHTGGVRRRLKEVDLPGEDDPVLIRDLPGDRTAPLTAPDLQLLGLPAVPLGPRAELLARLVAATPLSAWDTAGVDPAKVIDRALEQRELLVGVLAAITAQHDSRWASAFFARFPLVQLVPMVPPDQVVTQLRSRLARAATDGDLLAVLDAADRLAVPWSLPLSLDIVRRWQRVESRYLVGGRREQLAARLDVGATDEVEHWISVLTDENMTVAHGHVRQLHQALTMRRTILEEFA